MIKPTIIQFEDLRRGGTIDFIGAEHGFPVTFILDRSQPGGGPRLHRHTYDEVWILEEGQVEFTVGDDTLTAGSGSVATVPAGTPHRFTNTGTTPLRMVCIHPSANFQTEWL